MANAKRELSYDVAIATIVYFTKAWAGTFQPQSANPYKNIDRIKTPEEAKEQAKEGWDLLKAGLKWMTKGRG